MKKTAPSSFDPYRRWLGIPQSEQPAHHYRLLGIGLFEEDADVIQNAADRQMAHVRTFQAGPHSADSQRLLNELSAATICLLDAEKKTDYDHRLRRRLENKGELRSGARPTPPPHPPVVVGRAAAVPSGVAIEPKAFIGKRKLKEINIAPAPSEATGEAAIPMALLDRKPLLAPLAPPAAVATTFVESETLAATVAAPSHGARPLGARKRKTSAALAILLGVVALAMLAALVVLVVNRTMH